MASAVPQTRADAAQLGTLQLTCCADLLCSAPPCRHKAYLHAGFPGRQVLRVELMIWFNWLDVIAMQCCFSCIWGDAACQVMAGMRWP